MDAFAVQLRDFVLVVSECSPESPYSGEMLIHYD